MTIGVMSDTHKNIDLMNKAAGLMADRFAVEKIYHLGDDYEDADGLDGRGAMDIIGGVAAGGRTRTPTFHAD